MVSLLYTFEQNHFRDLEEGGEFETQPPQTNDVKMVLDDFSVCPHRYKGWA